MGFIYFNFVRVFLFYDIWEILFSSVFELVFYIVVGYEEEIYYKGILIKLVGVVVYVLRNVF